MTWTVSWVDGLTPEDAAGNFDGESSFTWPFAHVGNWVDSLINVRFQYRQLHPLIRQQRFRFGGTGISEDWESIQAAVLEVRDTARAYLQDLGDSDMDKTIPCGGSLGHLRETGLILGYAIMRAVNNYYYHIDEIATKRHRLGHQVGDYPSALTECL